jgi:hypothetical protein
MYVKILEPVSYARRRLITLIEERRFTAAARSYGIAASNISSLYRMAVGKIGPSFIMVFNLRRDIAPIEWFYNEGETLPKKKKFTPAYACFDRRARRHIIRKPTVGVARLEGLILAGGLQSLCRANGLQYRTVYGYAVKRRRHDGVAGYHARPSYGVMRKLRGVIHPDEWFFFPEEAGE